MSLDIASIALQENKLAPEMISELKAKVEQLVTGINRLIHDLRPPVLDDLGFESAIRWLLDSHLSTKGIKYYLLACDKFSSPESSILDKKTELRLFRIIQEAVINIQKHSYADIVSVTLNCTETHVEVDIVDDGVGFDTDEVFRSASTDGNKCFGLIGIRERVTHLDGELHIDSKTGEGTHLSATIPIVSAVTNYAAD